MSSNNCISVVLTTFNDEKTLPYVLESLASQGVSTECMELIIVDGGSIDSTIKMVEDFINKHRGSFKDIIFIKHERNFGVSRARNDGVLRASCPYILILDGDIVLPSNALKNMLEYLTRARGDSKVVGVVPLLSTTLSIYRKAVEGTVVRNTYRTTEAFLVVSDVIKRFLYNDSLGPPYTANEDIELGARLLKAGYEVHVLGYIVANHIKEQSSLYIVENSFLNKLSKIIKLLMSYFSIYAIKGFEEFYRNLPLMYKVFYLTCLLWLYITATLILLMLFTQSLIPSYITVIIITTIILLGLRIHLELKGALRIRKMHYILVCSMVALVNKSLSMLAYHLYNLRRVFNASN